MGRVGGIIRISDKIINRSVFDPIEYNAIVVFACLLQNEISVTNWINVGYWKPFNAMISELKSTALLHPI